MIVDLLESTSIARALANKNNYKLNYNQVRRKSSAIFFFVWFLCVLVPFLFLLPTSSTAMCVLAITKRTAQVMLA